MKRKKYHSVNAIKPAATYKRKVRKNLNADSLFAAIHKDFEQIPDRRGPNCTISLDDALMSGLAVFQLKHPSLLAFDKQRKKEPQNLHSMFGITNIPCDSQMRAILDPLSLSSLRAPFRTVFRHLQRGKDFEKMAYLDGHYLLSGDGTGFYSSGKVSSPYCMSKKSRNGQTLYYQQMYGASFVRPGCKVVIPVFPEMMTKQDGTNKNDCERNAAKRFYSRFRKEHPHLKVIVVEDALASNAPHIRELEKHNLRYILGAKPGDHAALFAELAQAVKDERATEMSFIDPEDRQTGHFSNSSTGFL
jgi:hypothetical protein